MRVLSSALLSQMYGERSNDPLLLLLQINHPLFTTPTLYLVNNTESIVSNGITYLPFPMKITLPVDDSESARSVNIQISNVGLELVAELRKPTTPASASIKAVLASNPNYVEFSFDELKLTNVSFDSEWISGTLTAEDLLTTSLIYEKYDTFSYPGLF